MLFPPTFTIKTLSSKTFITLTIETNLRQVEAVVKEQVVTLTATIETNLRQGDLETKVDGMKGDVTDTKTESNEALSVWEEGRITDS